MMSRVPHDAPQLLLTKGEGQSPERPDLIAAGEQGSGQEEDAGMERSHMWTAQGERNHTGDRKPLDSELI